MARARVYYKGLSDVREITAEQLKPLGVEVDRDLVFSRENGYAMNIDLNEELTKILRGEKTFTISEIKDDNTVGEEFVTATLRDDTADAAKALNARAGEEQEPEPPRSSGPRGTSTGKGTSTSGSTATA